MSLDVLADRLGVEKVENALRMELGYSTQAFEAPCCCAALEEQFFSRHPVQTVTKVLACSQEHAELAGALVEQKGEGHTIEILKGWDENGPLLPRLPKPPGGMVLTIS